ncbi:hypothetical protein L6164_017388 [Bauhinia variegata]|uniref:Uncharacterized protein n=1 Tax=Bauhinia variegata TaxID=167791 RepID=A0ACB9N9L5_BAUVA|nr:hypothetical protein L6164_017388 [Bauhinia variegata]
MGFDASYMESYKSYNEPINMIYLGIPGMIKPTPDDVTGALRNANIQVIGLHGKNNIEIQNVIEKALGRARRDNLFDDLVVADLKSKSNLEMIQEQVARALDLSLQDVIVYRLGCFLTRKSIIAERAGQIRERIRTKGRILIILHNLFQGFDMEQVGIPFGDTNGGSKILLASTNQQLLKDEMKREKQEEKEKECRGNGENLPRGGGNGKRGQHRDAALSVEERNRREGRERKEHKKKRDSIIEIEKERRIEESNSDVQNQLEFMEIYEEFAEPINRIYRGIPAVIKPTLDDVTGALRNANIQVIGLHGKNKIEIQNVIEKASRRACRDNLFDDLVVADFTNKSNLEMIQEQVARALDLSLQDGILYRLRCFLTGKSIIAERAGQIRERIRTKGRILIILHNIFQGFDMEQVGIPFGDTHGGSKILPASTNQQLLKDEMKSQLIFSLEDYER